MILSVPSGRGFGGRSILLSGLLIEILNRIRKYI